MITQTDLKSFPLHSGQEPKLPWTVVQVVPCTRAPSPGTRVGTQLLSASQAMARAGVCQLPKGYHFLTGLPKVGAFFFFLSKWFTQQVYLFLRYLIYMQGHTKSCSTGCEQEQNRKLRCNWGSYTTPTIVMLPSYRPQLTWESLLLKQREGVEILCILTDTRPVERWAAVGAWLKRAVWWHHLWGHVSLSCVGKWEVEENLEEPMCWAMGMGWSTKDNFCLICRFPQSWI